MVKVIFGQIEHRLFSHITTNWRGRPLTSHEVVLNTIAATTTRTGLRVEAVLDHGTYPTGVAVSRDQIQALPITPHAEHGPWNYSIAPTGASTAPPRADQRAKARTETLQLLTDPRLTSMSTAELDTLQARLAPTQAARSEQHRYVLRGGRRVATTGRSRSLLRDAVEVLLTVLYLRQVFPQKVLCDLLGINPVTISQAIKATRQLIDEQKISITPTVMRYFTHAEDLHAWNTNAGPATHPPTLPARAVSVSPTGPTPTAPNNLTVTNGDGSATLTWVSDINTTDHEIHMRNLSANESAFTKLPHPVPGERWTAELLVNGATYEFKLRAMNGLISGTYTEVVTARPSVPAPSAATNLTATGGNGTAKLSWTAGANASAYHIYMRNVTAGEAFQKLPHPVEGASWTADRLINGATYEFRLQSINGLIEGLTSDTVNVVPTTVPPAAPTGLTATAANHEAVLQWTAAANVTGYYVHIRNVTAGEEFRKLPYPVSGTSWTAETLVNGAVYQFKLQSITGLIEGSASATVTVTPTGPAPMAPTSVAAKAGDRKAVLTWKMPANATAAYIYTKNVSAGDTSFTKLPYPVHDDIWTATGLVNGAVYEYRIQAYNDMIAGETSTVVSVKPQGPPAPGPETIYATSGSQKVSLRWSGASHATGYDIWIREVTFGKDWRKLPHTVSDDALTVGLLVNGALYEFKVQSKDGLQAGGFSNTVSATPLGPTPQVSNLRWTSQLGEVALKWSGSSTSTGYYIHMRNKTRNEAFRELPYAVSGTSFTAKLIIPGEHYEFRVQAVSGLQRGVMSNTKVATSPLPPALSTLTLKPGIFSLKASWAPAPGVDSYTIYYHRSSSGSCSPLSLPSPGQFTEIAYTTITSYSMPYLFEPGCHWLLVAPTLYGVKSPLLQGNTRGSVVYKGDNDDSNLYEIVLTYIHKEMHNNSRSDVASHLYYLNDSGSALRRIEALANWFNLVRPGSVWDHKPTIGRHFGLGKETGDGYGYRYRISGMPYEVYYDIWSNIHYGYVGRRVGFTEWELQTGAAPIGVQDPGDVRSIGIGTELWNARGFALTRADVDSAVKANIGGYLNEEKVIPWSFRFVPNV